MISKKLLTPTNFIITGLILIGLFQFGVFDITLSTVNLIDPQTNNTFVCNNTYECYTKVSGQITGTERGPALACVSSKCVIQTCSEGEEVTKTCQDGTKITLSQCVDGQLEYPKEDCPVPECTSSQSCISAADTDCDEKLNPVFGTCTNFKCQYTPTPRCSQTEIIWNQYKWLIIFGGIVLLGIGGFLFRGKIIGAFN